MAIATATDIANQALDLLKEAPMTDYTVDTTPAAKWFRRNFDTARDGELEEHPWRFAVKEAVITVDATPPVFKNAGGGGWSYRYARPTDLMRVAYLNCGGNFEGIPVPHEIQGDWIYCDQSSTIYLAYIWRITDVTKYPALFCEALAAKLATKLAHWLTGKQTMVQVAAAAYVEALRRAKRANALLSTPERAYDSDVIAARYLGGTYGAGWPSW